jgi:hypothetical protein
MGDWRRAIATWSICSPRGPWHGPSPATTTPPSLRTDKVSFIRFRDGRIGGMWALEDTWTRIRQLAGHDVGLGELGSLG